MININLLPKNLRRRREPGYWRLIAVVLPLVVFGVVLFMQLTANQQVRALSEEKDLKEIRLATLQDAIREQQELQARLEQLNQLIAIRNTVREGNITWSAEIATMLETLPPRQSAAQPSIAFENLSMRVLSEDERQSLQNSGIYDGALAKAEMEVQGSALNAAQLADYLAALEDSPLFGVTFGSASRDEETGIYSFNLTIGALMAAADESATASTESGGESQ